LSEKKSDHRGIQKERGSLEKDLFIEILWEVIEKERNLIKTQWPRFLKIWNEYLVRLEPNPHKIRNYEVDKDAFFKSDIYKQEILTSLETSLVDGYYTIKSVVDTLFSKYFVDSEDFLNDIAEEDRVPFKFLTADVLIGSLLQFLSTEKEAVPIKYLIVAQNKSILRLKGRSDEQILDKLGSNGFTSSLEEVRQIMNELEKDGYIIKRDLSPSEKIKWKTGSFMYSWNKENDFKLSPEGEKFYKSKIFPVLEWCVGLWRSMYNIREMDVEILDSYKWKSFLEKTVSKAATQGFMTTYWVIKNIKKYYEMILEEKSKIMGS
jgi:hypothetical protein